MQIKPVTLRAFEFTLTEPELRDAIANPQVILPRFKAALNGAFDDPSAPTPVISGDGRIVDESHPLRYGNSPKGKRAVARRGQSDARVKKPCSVCGKPIAAKFMKIHLSRKHTEVVAETPTM